MYFSISILCLSIAALIGFHIGSRSAVAQAPEPIAGYSMSVDGDLRIHYVMLSNGDVYGNYNHGASHSMFPGPAQYRGNFWTGTAPVPTSPTTWGGVKGKYEVQN
jgi:hypothetical protein